MAIRVHVLIGATIAALAALAPMPAAAQAEDDWSGFYLGAQATGSRDSVSADSTLLVTQVSNLFQTGRGLVVVPGTTRSYAASKTDTGVTGGGFAGYQRQFNRIVVGVEGDFAPFSRTVSLVQSQTLPVTALTPSTTISARRDVRLDNQWSARLRIGYAAGKTLFYLTGGYAQSHARVTSIDSFTNPGGLAAIGNCIGNPTCQANFGPEGPVVTTAVESHALGGWTAGAGVEHKIGKALSIGLDYRHTDLGSTAFTLANQTIVNTGPTTVGDNGQPGLLGSVSTGPTRIKARSDALSLRVAFHF